MARAVRPTMMTMSMTIHRQWVDIQGPGVGFVELFESCWLVGVVLAFGAVVAVDVVGPGAAEVDDVVGPVAKSPKLGAPFPALGQTPWYHF